MPGLLPHVDPDGLLEYSVVYTDRALNHMSRRFQRVMQDVSATLKSVYGARSAIVVPGSGSFGMESVARQFATGKNVLVIRNGWFSYRWSQIFEMGAIPARTQVLKARTTGPGPQAPFAPAPIAEVVATIRETKPDLVFAPHVETAAGLMLPHDYLRAVAAAVHEHGGLFVLDCVASGSIWVDMPETGVDIIVGAPQKGWSSTPCSITSSWPFTRRPPSTCLPCPISRSIFTTSGIKLKSGSPLPNWMTRFASWRGQSAR